MRESSVDTNEQLREATDKLAGEVHDLGERLSAKELLYQRTRRLTRLSLGLAAIVGVVALVAVAALVRVNSVLSCTIAWGEASSIRQDVLNDGAEEVAQKKGSADGALRILVDRRGDPNDEAIDQAKRDFAKADDARIRAEWQLQFLRDQYPPPQIKEFCGAGAAPEELSDPKAEGTNPVPSKSPTSRAPQQQ